MSYQACKVWLSVRLRQGKSGPLGAGLLPAPTLLRPAAARLLFLVDRGVHDRVDFPSEPAGRYHHDLLASQFRRIARRVTGVLLGSTQGAYHFLHLCLR